MKNHLSLTFQIIDNSLQLHCSSRKDTLVNAHVMKQNTFKLWEKCEYENVALHQICCIQDFLLRISINDILSVSHEKIKILIFIMKCLILITIDCAFHLLWWIEKFIECLLYAIYSHFPFSETIAILNNGSNASINWPTNDLTL